MRFRKLRIAWSVAWGIAAVLLCVLWVRSYIWREGWTLASRFHVESYYGRIEYLLLLPPFSFAMEEPSYYYESAKKAARSFFSKPGLVKDHLLEIRHQSSPRIPGVVPHWLPLLLSATSAVAPWIRYLPWRFSLRTLLIATTLIAVVLGLIVWLRSL